MIGNAVKCDECGKVDVHDAPNGIHNTFRYKWFRVTPPQTIKPNEATKVDDICSLKCLQEYSQGWTTSA